MFGRPQTGRPLTSRRPIRRGYLPEREAYRRRRRGQCPSGPLRCHLFCESPSLPGRSLFSDRKAARIHASTGGALSPSPSA